MAKLCLENGVLMFSLSNPSRVLSIQRHKTSEVNTTKICMRCYAYNDRLTDNCTKSPDCKICSEYSSTYHISRTCSSSAKMCNNCLGDHRTISDQCSSVKLIKQQQSEVVESASSSAPTPVSRRSAPIPVTYASKTSFSDVVKQSTQYHHLTKDDAFERFVRNIYASQMCAGSADIFQIDLEHLLQKNSLPSFAIGDRPPLPQKVSQPLLLIPTPIAVIHPSLEIT